MISALVALIGTGTGVFFAVKNWIKLVKSNSKDQNWKLITQIAAKAVCFKEALSDDFKAYGKAVVDNAQALCKGLMDRDIKIVSGGTDNHLMLIDLTNYGLTGKAIES